MTNNYTNDKESFEALVKKYDALKSEIAKIIIGQDDVVRDLLISIFSNGHSLLVGVPGLAKTLMVNTLAKTLGLNFKRIQFTPDLMPSDIIGTEILDENRKFKFIKGPVFSNIVLADEINRTPPKTQAALLEAMQERTVTVAGREYELDQPFFVLATQNPIEQEGTYPLPEAQLDRFMFNLILDYPQYSQELDIVKGTTGSDEKVVNNIISGEEILFFQNLIKKLPVADNVYEYAVKLVNITRPNRELAHDLSNKYLLWGAGPRASQFMIIAAKVHAAFNGKLSPDIEDVKAVAPSILRHRIVPNYKAEADGYTVEKLISIFIDYVK
ncbi:MAG: AAA family ATPase [Bacteroidetes bacterium]|nr:MAG: AAA family ATPase [Bacteroidota bacterium]